MTHPLHRVLLRPIAVRCARGGPVSPARVTALLGCLLIGCRSAREPAPATPRPEPEPLASPADPAASELPPAPPPSTSRSVGRVPPTDAAAAVARICADVACVDALARLDVWRDAAGAVQRLYYSSVVGACGGSVLRYYDADGREVVRLSTDPSTPWAEIAAEHARQTSGLRVAEAIVAPCGASR
jgi:hypothetical protein